VTLAREGQKRSEAHDSAVTQLRLPRITLQHPFEHQDTTSRKYPLERYAYLAAERLKLKRILKLKREKEVLSGAGEKAWLIADL
jgi:hypothetical protein